MQYGEFEIIFQGLQTDPSKDHKGRLTVSENPNVHYSIDTFMTRIKSEDLSPCLLDVDVADSPSLTNN